MFGNMAGDWVTKNKMCCHSLEPYYDQYFGLIDYFCINDSQNLLTTLENRPELKKMYIIRVPRGRKALTDYLLITQCCGECSLIMEFFKFLASSYFVHYSNRKS